MHSVNSINPPTVKGNLAAWRLSVRDGALFDLFVFSVLYARVFLIHVEQFVDEGSHIGNVEIAVKIHIANALDRVAIAKE